MLRYLSQRDETGLGLAYELGRDAMRDSVGLLDVVRVHHELFLDVLATASRHRRGAQPRPSGFCPVDGSHRVVRDVPPGVHGVAVASRRQRLTLTVSR